MEKGLIEIVTTADGTIRFRGEKGSTIVKQATWEKSRATLEKALGKAYAHPIIYRYDRPTDHSGQGPCFPGNSLVSVPSGFVEIENLKSGDFVWTIDKFGYRVQEPILQKTKKIVSKNHKTTHIVLKDGRKLVMSPGHPTIDYREIGSLVKGDDLDMSTIASIRVVPYKGKYTYDILPYGDTGGYWANNILIGSTLSDQFQRTISDAFRLSQVYTDLPHVIRSLASRVIGVAQLI